MYKNVHAYTRIQKYVPGNIEIILLGQVPRAVLLTGYAILFESDRGKIPNRVDPKIFEKNGSYTDFVLKSGREKIILLNIFSSFLTACTFIVHPVGRRPFLKAIKRKQNSDKNDLFSP